jgi:GntR family transcriptional regulator, transcriptional repressor for pyruvate dehydrogenase complex
VFEAVGRDARLSDKVTEAIMRTIVSNRLKPGDALPPERELGKQFGVSRTVIREAIRALHAKGLLEVRSGSGARIVAVDSKTVRESMHHFVKGCMVDDAKVDEVRRVLEVAAAGIAAERATEADMERIDATLREMAESVDDPAASIEVDLEFHRAIARATHNELLGMLHDVIGELLVEARRRNFSLGPPERRRVIEMHTAIRDRVAGHDPDAARQATRDHLDHVHATWNGRVPDLHD